MSNIGLIIEERPASIGTFTVGRLLPFRKKRAVGPFVFMDHMGPALLSKEENFDVLPHPHIGLSTLTYLLEGEIVHRDSLGTEIEITPGAVNWMTAGKGIVHSERTPARLRTSPKSVHGLQIWIALPKPLEESEPSFIHIPAADIPQWEENGLSVKLIAGEAFGKKSPVPVYSPLYFIEVKSDSKQNINLAGRLCGETAIFILEGSVTIEGTLISPRQILVLNNNTLSGLELSENSTVFVLGGEPFPEERYIHWNFVSSDKALIEKAKKDWIAQTFPKIPGETEFVPLPGAG